MLLSRHTRRRYLTVGLLLAAAIRTVRAQERAKQHRMATITALALLECVTPTTWTAPLATWALWIILVLSLVTAGRRLFRTAAFLRSPR